MSKHSRHEAYLERMNDAERRVSDQPTPSELTCVRCFGDYVLSTAKKYPDEYCSEACERDDLTEIQRSFQP